VYFVLPSWAAESHGMANIEVETDSSLLKEALRSSERDLEPSGMHSKPISG
jgi:hypothetical protein